MEKPRGTGEIAAEEAIKKGWLSIDVRTGVVHWAVRRGPMRPGDRAGSIDGKGYRQIGIENTKVMEHRLIWFFANGKWPKALIDHINGKITDNRIENLRQVTDTGNRRAYSKPRGGTSIFRGVDWNATSKKWRARIGVNGKQINLGLFESEIEAASAYNCAAVDYGFFPEALNKISCVA